MALRRIAAAMRLYAETYLALLSENEPLTLAHLRKAGELEARLQEIEDDYKEQEMELVMQLRRSDPLPNELLPRLGRVGNDASMAREIVLDRLSGLFRRDERESPSGAEPCSRHPDAGDDDIGMSPLEQAGNTIDALFPGAPDSAAPDRE